MTVASPSSIAATMSPFSALGCWRIDDVVAVADRRVDHRVTDDLEQEQLAVADELAGEREDVLDALLGEDRTAGGDPADHGHVGGHRGGVAVAGLVVRRLGRRPDRPTLTHRLGQHDLERAGEAGSFLRKPFSSSTRSWWATLDVLVRPTALPISRMLGG